MSKIESTFLTWFEEQHGKREKDTAQTDEMLREQAMAGEKAQTELLRRTEWDARYQSALYAWQAAGGATDFFFVPEKTIEKVDLSFLLGQKNGPLFSEILDSVLADEDFPTGAAQVTGTNTGAVAEYGDATEAAAPASSFTDPATGMIFETRHLGAFRSTKILSVGNLALSSDDGWSFRHDSPNPEGTWLPFDDLDLMVQTATAGGGLMKARVYDFDWSVRRDDPTATIVAARTAPFTESQGRKAEEGESDDDEPKDPPEKCPGCGQITVVPKSSGVACTDPKCGYTFCA